MTYKEYLVAMATGGVSKATQREIEERKKDLSEGNDEGIPEPFPDRPPNGGTFYRVLAG